MWVYESHESEERERPVCRSEAVDKKVKGHEDKLRAAI
jgi:hypothetical protein